MMQVNVLMMQELDQLQRSTGSTACVNASGEFITQIIYTSYFTISS